MTCSFPCSSGFYSSSVLGVVRQSWSSAPVGMGLVRGSLCDWDFYHVDICLGKFDSKGRWYCGPSQVHATWGWDPELCGASAGTRCVMGDQYCFLVPQCPSHPQPASQRGSEGSPCEVWQSRAFADPISHKYSRGVGFCPRWAPVRTILILWALDPGRASPEVRLR